MSAPAQKPAAPIITRGIIPAASRVGIYGPEGIGKSTLAAQFPDPIFADVEGGTTHLDVARLSRPQSWPDIVAVVQWLLTSRRPVSVSVLRHSSPPPSVFRLPVLRPLAPTCSPR